MAIDFSVVLKDTEGFPLQEFIRDRDEAGKFIPARDAEGNIIQGQVTGESKNITLKDISIAALTGPHENETPPPTASEQGQRYQMIQKILAGGEIEFSAPERELIQKLINYVKHWNTLIKGQAYTLLNK